MKWGDPRPAYLRLFSSLWITGFFFLCTGNLALSQVLVFEQLVTPFEVLDLQGEPFSRPFLGGFNVPRPQLVDIDGDGDDDLFVQERSNEVIFFEHLAEEEGVPFIKRSDAFLGLEVGEWYRFVDLDQDGDQDLLAEAPFSFIRVYENTGDTREPAFSVAQDSLRDETGQPIFADRQNILTVVDIDNDQLLDLFIGRLDGTVFHYEQVVGSVNVQNLTFRLQSEKFQDILVVGPQGKREERHGANTLFFFDVDRDSDYDLFWGDFFEEGLLFFQNVGTPQVPLFLTDLVRFPINDPLLTSGYNAPAFGDVNNDGLDDLLVGVLGGAFSAFGAATDNLLYIEQEVEDQFSLVRPRFLSNIDVGSDSYPVLFDVDRDGDTDLLLGNSIDPEDPNTGAVRFFENTGTANAPAFKDTGNLPLEADFGITPALGDLNGDGAVDMVTGSFSGEMTLYWNANDGDSFTFSAAVPAFLDIPTGASSTPFLADMDADEDLDLLVGQSSGVINFFENTGTAEQPQFSLVTSSYGGIDVGRRSVPLAKDVDGDGDLDLVIGSDQDGIQTFENTGTPQEAVFEPVEWIDLDIQRRMVPAWGDLTGDAKPELMIGLLNGGVLYYENRSRPLSIDLPVAQDGVAVSLYPNPALDVVHLRVNGGYTQPIKIDLFDLLGQYHGTVYEGVVGGAAEHVDVDVSSFAAGVYIVRILVGSDRFEKVVLKAGARR